MSDSVALVCVAGGETYVRYAEEMFESAREFFRPTSPHRLIFEMLEGEDGWPAGTMCRHSRLLRQMPRARYVFMVDADMRFEAPCGAEILPSYDGITAARHPGYVGKSREELPYEKDPQSRAYMPPNEGAVYYAGGFVGGERLALRMLSTQIETILEMDLERGLIPTFHDESALNRVLYAEPPAVTLSPAYVHPDNDAYYRSLWPIDYPRILVALDKTQAERGDR